MKQCNRCNSCFNYCIKHLGFKDSDGHGDTVSDSRGDSLVDACGDALVESCGDALPPNTLPYNLTSYFS